MKTRLINLWQNLRSSYWVIPSLLSVGAILLAVGMVSVDEIILTKGFALPDGVYKGGPEGARTLLSTVAGSMINVTGITFSITIVALTLASSQFGSRLLRNFMRDTGNQVVLGVFLATFVYCLIVLWTVRGGTGETVFVPHLSITVGFALTLGSLGVLIYFIHHTAQSIQAENVIAAVGRDLDEAIDYFYPEKVDAGFEEEIEESRHILPPYFESEACSVLSQAAGYLLAIELDSLVRQAQEHDLVIKLCRSPGHYVMVGTLLAKVWPAHAYKDDSGPDIKHCFLLGKQRSGEQDVEFAAHQLVEIALRALSPGMNDTFTALHCIDRLGDSLARLAKRRFPSRFVYDEDRELRVVTVRNSFEEILNTSFDQIRQNGRKNAAVTIRLLEMIREIGLQTERPAHRKALLRQAEMIERGSREGLPEEEDRKDVRHCFDQIRMSWQE
jgi:uncharacterized membrane protein